MTIATVDVVDPMIELVRLVNDNYQTYKEAAAALGISAQYLADMCKGRRGISPAMLDKLNLREVIVRK